MYRDSADAGTYKLTLPRVETGADFEAERADRVSHRQCATNASGGAVKNCEEPVPGDINLATTKSRHFSAHEGMVALDQIPPCAITDPRGMLCRAHDVDEENGGQHPIVVG
jgi:hypothetical protein